MDDEFLTRDFIYENGGKLVRDDLSYEEWEFAGRTYCCGWQSGQKVDEVGRWLVWTKQYEMLFDTGVRPQHVRNPPFVVPEYGVIVDGTVHVKYFLEEKPPEGKPLYLAPYNYTPAKNEVAIRIVGGGMHSAWAIFRK